MTDLPKSTKKDLPTGRPLNCSNLLLVSFYNKKKRKRRDGYYGHPFGIAKQSIVFFICLFLT